MQTGRWERKAEEGPSIWGPDHVLGKGSVDGRQRVAVPIQPGNRGGQPFSPSPPALSIHADSLGTVRQLVGEKHGSWAGLSG